MKRSLYLLISLLLMSCFCSLISFATEDEPCISVSSASGNVGETVSVRIILSENPGLVAMRLYVAFDDSKLQLLNATDGCLFGIGNNYFGNSIAENPYTLMWEDSLARTNYTANGQLATLSFRILDANTEKTDVTVVVDTGSTFGVDLVSVAFSTRNGFVEISKPNSGISNTRIKLSDQTVMYKQSTKLLPILEGETDAHCTVCYSDYDRQIISIDSDGNMLGLKRGTTSAVCTLTDQDGKSKSCQFNVTVQYAWWQWIVRILFLGFIWY